jgi:hypothetical protein
MTVWSATEGGDKPDQLRDFKIDRYRRISCSILEGDEPAEESGVHGALYRHDPTNEENTDSE